MTNSHYGRKATITTMLINTSSFIPHPMETEPQTTFSHVFLCVQLYVHVHATCVSMHMHFSLLDIEKPFRSRMK